MNIDRLVQEAAQEMKKCAKCGACRSVCPVFDSENRVEKYAARGKLSLFESVYDAQAGISKQFKSVLNNCLLCLACVKNCSSGVQIDKIIIAARALAMVKTGQSPVKAVIYRGILSNPGTSNFIFKKAAWVQDLAFKKIPETSGLHYRFPFDNSDRYIPSFQARTFRESLPEHIGQDPPGERIVLFTGCAVNHLMPQIGHAAVRVLKKLRVGIIIPVDQGCCGAPVETGGDIETISKIAKQNIDVLSRYPDCKIITLCASGGFMLKKKYPQLLCNHEKWAGESLDIAGRTLDISEYLIRYHENALKKMTGKKSQDPITYHDPCHLVRGQNIASEPRKLLNMVVQDSFREMDRPDRCCGSGGSYGVTHLNNYHKILAEKIDSIQMTCSRRIATGCPACIIALKDGLEKFGSKKVNSEVRHTIEYLAENLFP
ncbi:(Fe-S)-binding protein [Desulfospira joergensenii]|uniref:(Fe-S)-binding protein n=1 Tax=Desulfospira joergensenii TaxID=53329 RepID=UPI0003B4E1A3|nr:(Fe-S)-binding protein [Desulfospira joergensenii]